MSPDNEIITKGVKIFGCAITIERDGITADSLGELASKLEWCRSVGLQQDPIRMQPHTWHKLIVWMAPPIY